ncbi:hypothetical protein ABPG77_008971 [Micractinium sp. CCAP 211/92]
MSSFFTPPPAEGLAKGASSDGGYSMASQMAALQKRNNRMMMALGVLSALCVALLGVSIAALVDAKDAQSSVSRLEDSLSTGASSSGVLSSGLAGSTAVSMPPGVYVSTDPTPPTGYLAAGSIYRGSGYWSNSSSNLPAARSEFATAPLTIATPGAESGMDSNRTVIYLLGGTDATGAPTSTVITYDAVLDQYNTSLAPMPSPRARLAAAATDGDTIVAVGGYNSTDAQTPESCVFIYSVSGNSWTEDCNGDVLADACAAAIDGVVYIVGGTMAGGQLSSAIRSYSPSTKTWKADAASLPTARADAACAASGGVLYIAGGRGADGALLNELIAYEPATGEVKTFSPLAYGSGDVELVALPNGSLLSIGGITNTSTPGLQAPSHYVQQYLPTVDTWVQKAPIALARLRAGAAYSNGGVFAFGGIQRCNATAGGACPERPIADVEVYYDIDRPAVFLHLRDPAADSAPDLPTSKVLLSSDVTPKTNFTNMGLLHAGSGYWAAEEPLPVAALADHSVVPVGNSLFILGGQFVNNQTISDAVWEFDSLLSTYTRRASMPTPRTRMGAAALGGKIYAVGGYETLDETEGPQGLFVYDIEADEWTVSDAELKTPRADACMAAVGGLLYLGGGYSTNYSVTLDSVEVFDPNSEIWTELGQSMPTPRGDLMCTSLTLSGVENYVVVGGYYDPTNQFLPGAFRSEVEAYSPESAAWTTLAPIPQARGDNALVTLPGNRMLVMGGETNTDGHNQVASNNVDLYLADYDRWVPMAPMPEPRFRFDAAAANGFVYAFGGDTTSLFAADGNITTRGGAQTAFKYLDVQYPDVFVFVNEE